MHQLPNHNRHSAIHSRHLLQAKKRERIRSLGKHIILRRNGENIETLLLDREIGLEGFLFLCEREVPDVRGHCMIAELEKQGQQPVQLAICIVSNAGHIFGRDLFIFGIFPFSFRPEFIGHCLYTGNEPCFAPVVQHMADEVRLMVFTENGSICSSISKSFTSRRRAFSEMFL